MTVRKCTICNDSKKRAAIEQAILAGLSNVVIGEKFGYGRMTVARHKIHMPVLLVQDEVIRAGIENHDVFAELDKIKRKLSDIISNEKPEIQIKAMSEYRQVLSMAATLTVSLERWRHSNISESEEWLKVKEIILEVLSEYPGAKEKLLAQLGGVNANLIE
jgi:hypothetical protein